MPFQTIDSYKQSLLYGTIEMYSCVDCGIHTWLHVSFSYPYVAYAQHYGTLFFDMV